MYKPELHTQQHIQVKILTGRQASLYASSLKRLSMIGFNCGSRNEKMRYCNRYNFRPPKHAKKICTALEFRIKGVFQVLSVRNEIFKRQFPIYQSIRQIHTLNKRQINFSCNLTRSIVRCIIDYSVKKLEKLLFGWLHNERWNSTGHGKHS